MSAVYLFDDTRARGFQPFALTRPAGEMRAGALLVRERWTRLLGVPAAGHLTSAHLTGFDEPGAAPVLTDGVIPAGVWLAHSRFLPALSREPLQTAAGRLECDGMTAAVRIARDLPVADLADGARDLSTLATGSASGKPIDGWWAEEVWDYVRHLVPMLDADIPVLGSALEEGVPPGSISVGTHPVFLEPGAVVEPSVCFDAGAGPIFICAGAHVQAFTRLVGPLYVGHGSTVSTDFPTSGALQSSSGGGTDASSRG